MVNGKIEINTRLGNVSEESPYSYCKESGEVVESKFEVGVVNRMVKGVY